ncbi:MAG: hypothetical protein JXD19_08375 [Deltaproteobacteria bacterium]|nr:hypothetical protein [Deltaproteobacteria bacterium]
MKRYNALIIGSGPAGIFTALHLERFGVDKIAVFDQNCYPAGGLLNDGKLNFDHRIGLDLDELGIDPKTAREYIQQIKSVLTGFPHCRQVTFAKDNEKIAGWERIARERNVQFIGPEQWHWGTDNGKGVVDYLRGLLHRTTFLLGTEVKTIETGNGMHCLICRENSGMAEYAGPVVLAAPGRKGAYWFRDVARTVGIHNNFGPVDVGIRVELNRKFYDPVSDVVYDPKFILRTTRHQDKVRTFCTNPGGRVRIEHYGDFRLVNGDALSSRKTANTNFALLNTVMLTQPFSDTTKFGQMIAKQFHLLGGGRPIVQRVGDFREGSRSRQATFESEIRHFTVCRATCRAVPGDITLGLPARIVDNLWEALKTLDKIVPGILHPSTLLYAPEIKFFDTHFRTDEFMETNIKGIFVAGDGTGKSRGIVGAALTGILAAQGMAQRYLGKDKLD